MVVLATTVLAQIVIVRVSVTPTAAAKNVNAQIATTVAVVKDHY